MLSFVNRNFYDNAMIIRSTLVFLLILSISDIACSQSEWQKIRDSDGIVVFTRKVGDSKTSEFRVETTMPGNLVQYRKILSQIDQYQDWLPSCKESTILNTISGNEIIYYVVLNMPFPFTDRDMIQHIQFHSKKDSLMVRISNEPNYKPEVENRVRMINARGKWLIRQIDSNKISVVFQYLADPDGGLPAWLVNAFIAENPYKTIYNLRELMRRKN